jgi:hypothetical protein
MKAVLLGIMMVCAVPAAAMAFQCPTLQAQIDKAVGNRFDASAQTLRQKAAMAANLHKAGKHAESVKAYEDAAKAGNVQLMMKK